MAALAAKTDAESKLAGSLRGFACESGRPLVDLLEESPVLLVFLRHFSCAFCAQTLDQVSKIRGKIEAEGVRPVFVHLGSPERAKPYFDYYGLSDVERVSDPEARLYQLPEFGLSRKNPYLHSLHPAVLWGWIKGALFKYGIGVIKEDGEQMPGVFFIKDGRITRAFRHRTIADQPNYLKLVGAG
ncbi:MAG TPA: AhpC/TSA family protein [Terracidiphilus sp.]|nr:AhpC/TSA family protein [Terracidiphilus sp.]